MQNKEKKKRINRIKRHNRVRAKIIGTNARPRLSVYKSNKGYSVQLIDDEKNLTIASVSTGSKKDDLKKVEADIKELKGKGLEGYKCGIALAEKAKAKKVSTCVFDNGGFRYHGRIKAVAEGARAGGLKF